MHTSRIRLKERNVDGLVREPGRKVFLSLGASSEAECVTLYFATLISKIAYNVTVKIRRVFNHREGSFRDGGG